MIWDAQTGKILLTLQIDTGDLSPWLGDPLMGVIAWSPDGQWLAAGGALQEPASGESNGMLVIWDTHTGQQTHLLTAGMLKDRVTTIAWSPQGKRLAAGLYTGQIAVWDMTSFTPLALLQGHIDGVSALAWSPDGSMLASSTPGWHGAGVEITQ